MLKGGMVWKIGRQTDIFEQIRWIADNGFDAVSFHTCNCLNGGSGIDPANIRTHELNRLKEALKPFKMIDLHAPFENFDVNLASPNELIRKASVQYIKDSIAFATKVEAATLTVHTGKMRNHLPPELTTGMLAKSLSELEEAANRANIMIGVEADTLQGYELIQNIRLPHVGLTLDTGHMCFDNGRGWKDFGSIGNVIRNYRDKVAHMHFHDFDGTTDHLPLGYGQIDFHEIVQALTEIEYSGSICLELSPQHAQEKEIIESKELLEQLISETQKTEIQNSKQEVS